MVHATKPSKFVGKWRLGQSIANPLINLVTQLIALPTKTSVCNLLIMITEWGLTSGAKAVNVQSFATPLPIKNATHTTMILGNLLNSVTIRTLRALLNAEKVKSNVQARPVIIGLQ
jgi:hypothetical protein